MSSKGEILYHPINGTEEQTWDGFSWPAFFFGVIWLLVKGLYAHFLINMILVLITFGFAAPVIWIVYGFIGNGAHKKKLLGKGYLTAVQWANRSGHEESARPKASASSDDSGNTIQRLSELANLKDRGVLTEEEFLAQKAKILRS